MSGWTRILVAMTAGLAVVCSAAVATAGPNDPRLSGFLSFERQEVEDSRVWGHADPDEEAFRQFSRDLGQVFAPRVLAPAETLGQAGFAVQMMTSFSNIPRDEDYWSRGLEGGRPESLLFSSHLQVRKGLPFSFEVAGNLSNLASSQMFAMGADLRWALHEGYAYFPDIGVRGSVNTVTGAPELNLVNASWDLALSKSFGVGGVMALTPYAGYQQLHTFASSRVLNSQPQDPRPPQTLSRDGQPNLVFAPEAVFEQQHEYGNRFFLGTRLKVWILAFTVEALFSDPVDQFTFSAGVDF